MCSYIGNGGLDMARKKVQDEGLKLSKSPRGRFNELGKMEKEQKMKKEKKVIKKLEQPKRLPKPDTEKEKETKGNAKIAGVVRSKNMIDNAAKKGAQTKRIKDKLDKLKNKKRVDPKKFT
jgi:hypothetical protein